MDARLTIDPCPLADTLRLQRELKVSRVVAQVLVRRGLSDPDAARAFLDPREEHAPDAFQGIAGAVSTMMHHVSAGDAITVHGDYDVDGVCSTAILVRALRGLGARVDWYLPDRASDGYGLSLATVESLAARGTRLLLTADCAVTAVEAVARARALGLVVVVTDHHSPRADGVLPDATIVHPTLCGYPCADLCATAVAYKLALALYAAAGRDTAPVVADLDLVALATIADVVPLVGENRTLVTRGLRALAATAKPGLRALMEVARVQPGRVDARAVGFGLAPRINASGRLQRADAALELVLTEDPVRAGEIARELDSANHERRHVETRIVFEAQALMRELPDQAAYVLAGEGWHAGVIGIVAARIAERHHRPVVCVALEGDRARGSARSIPAFDLLGGLDACAEHLIRHGGHRAAAGVELSRDKLEAFTAAFVAHAASVLAPEDLMPVERVDAVAGGDELGLALAEELSRLAPFGRGNPAVSLLVPAANLRDAQPMGEGRHVRFTVDSGGASSRAVAFGTGGRLPIAEGTRADATFTLEVNEYNGTVEPRLVLRQATTCTPRPAHVVGEPADYMGAIWARLADHAAERSSAAPANDAQPAPQTQSRPQPSGAQRTTCDRRGHGIAGALRALVASGEPLLVVCADARRRREHLSGRVGGFDLCSYDALEHDRSLGARYTHVAALDPPAGRHQEALMATGSPDGYLHLLWGESETRFALGVLERDNDLRPPLRGLYRALRDAGTLSAGPLQQALEGDLTAAAPGAPTRAAGLAASLLLVLDEVGLADVDLARNSVSVRLPAPPQASLELSATFREHLRRLEEGRLALAAGAVRAA